MVENTDNLKRLRAIRSGNRGVVTKYTREAVELLKREDEASKDRLRTIANLLDEKMVQLKQLYTKVLELCEIDDIVQEIEDTEETKINLSRDRVKTYEFFNCVWTSFLFSISR